MASTCGHEWTGFVSKAGSSVDVYLKVTGLLLLSPSCGNCSACQSGQMEKCQTVLMATVGRGPFATPHGGFAKQLAIHHGRAVKANSD